MTNSAKRLGAGSNPSRARHTRTACAGLRGSNADQIKDLNGPFCTAGFSAGDYYFAGADFSWGTDSQGCPV